MALASHWLEDCANFKPTQEKKKTNTPLVISKHDKNKQLTLLSKRKLALIAINKLLAL
jgi:hypothetical protein